MLGYPALLVRVLALGLPLLVAGCAALMPAPTPILPPEELYKKGETELGNRRYEDARTNFRKIVERHGGALSVTSRAGHGTVFTITLPLTGPPARPSR